MALSRARGIVTTLSAASAAAASCGFASANLTNRGANVQIGNFSNLGIQAGSMDFTPGDIFIQSAIAASYSFDSAANWASGVRSFGMSSAATIPDEERADIETWIALRSP